MALTHWNPLREMDEFFAQMNRGVRAPGGPTGEGGTQLGNWSPVVDISETDKEYVVKAELAGVAKDDVQVDLNKGVLTLSGERRFEKSSDKDEKHHRVERWYGSFARSFTVPEDVAADRISATCSDGVLTVRLPKSEVVKPKLTRIPVG